MVWTEREHSEFREECDVFAITVRQVPLAGSSWKAIGEKDDVVADYLHRW